jgi:hypothetical protein
MKYDNQVQDETFEKESILFKVKEGENYIPPDFHRDSQEYPRSISRIRI